MWQAPEREARTTSPKVNFRSANERLCNTALLCSHQHTDSVVSSVFLCELLKVGKEIGVFGAINFICMHSNLRRMVNAAEGRTTQHDRLQMLMES